MGIDVCVEDEVCLSQRGEKTLFVEAENGPIKATRLLVQTTKQEKSKSSYRGGSQGRRKGRKAIHPRVQMSKLQASWACLLGTDLLIGLSATWQSVPAFSSKP